MKYSAVLRWPVREGLLALVEVMRERALEHHRWEVQLFVAGGLKEEPKLPEILMG